MPEVAEEQFPADTAPTTPGEVVAPIAAHSGAVRYRIEDREDGRVIVSGNAPNIVLRIERGLTVDGRGRKRFGPNTVFLDGVYAGAPFCDNEARHYSLDHHAGCVRAFTLSTCEQAVVMLLQGLPLSADDWTLYVNDPDLDSMLAAWVLLNHMELLRDDKALLRRAMPVIRLEGVIDAHGTEREILTGFPQDVHDAVRGQVDALMARERELKTSGAWLAADWTEYAQGALDTMDRMLMPAEALDALLETQEAGRASLENNRIAVLLESSAGIYEVEARLKERYGKTLGLIVLQTGPNRYTLRLADAFLRKDLNAVYKALNKVDPKARPGGEKPNVWGGSGDIGGSPRGSGTGLTGQEILDVVREVLGVKPPLWKRIWNAMMKLVKGSPPALPPG